jgi:hypothetical protein
MLCIKSQPFACDLDSHDFILFPVLFIYICICAHYIDENSPDERTRQINTKAAATDTPIMAPVDSTPFWPPLCTQHCMGQMITQQLSDLDFLLEMQWQLLTIVRIWVSCFSS